MATVTGFTAEKIIEMLGAVGALTPEQIEALGKLGTISQNVSDNKSKLDDLTNNVIPKIDQDVASGALDISELSENRIPNLERDLLEAQAEVTDMRLSGDLRPRVYAQPEEPTSPDINGRQLVVGDVWVDAETVQRIWDGNVWSDLKLDIPDLSITVQKFKTGTHMIY